MCWVLCLSVCLRAGDWPGWLGPDRNGVSSETDLIDRFGPAGPTIKWRFPLYKGFSSIAATNDFVYAMGADHMEYAVCLNAKDGELIWQAPIGKMFEDTMGGHGPRATPLIWQDRLFVISGYGNLHALDRETGRTIWSRKLTQHFDGETPSWGYSGSPIIQDNRLLIATGSTTLPALLALDPESGSIIWQTRPGLAGYATPVIFGSQKSQAVFFASDALVSIDLQQGHQLWEHPWKTPWSANAATPVLIGPNQIFISSGYGKGSALLKAPSGKGSVQTVWQNKRIRSAFSTPIYHQGYLYGFDNATLKCIDIAANREQWKQRGFGQGSLILADGKLIVLGEKGKLALIKADPSQYTELDRARPLNRRCWTMPTLAHATLYIRDERTLLAIDLSKPDATP